MEIWKDIPEYEGLYRVSNTGKVMSLTYNKIRKLRKDEIGYLRIGLNKNNKCRNHLVHRLVLLSFIGKSDLQCNHKNGNKQDNRLDNLEYVTRKENMAHAVLKGLVIYDGEKNNNSKLTQGQVDFIKSMANKKVDRGYWVKLSHNFKVSTNEIWRIRRGLSWNK